MAYAAKVFAFFQAIYLPDLLFLVILNAFVSGSLDIYHKDFLVELQVKVVEVLLSSS